MCLLALASSVCGAPLFQIYPHPQRSELRAGADTLSATPTIVGADQADPDALRLLKECLATGTTGEGSINKIIIGQRGDPGVAAYMGDLPEKSGAYRILSGGSQLVMVGHDGRGTYYAVQTLRQLLEAGGNTGRLPTGDLTDWPDVPFRGVVEGFYGTPWSHDGRLSLIRFFGKHKLDTYIYGPKDDPFHSSPNWRKPYPPQEAARIRELVAACRANKVDFVWAIHPGKDIKWNDGDLRNVIAKFEAMYALGVRSYAVFFDDISGEGTKADKQAELLNRLHHDFIVPKGDVTPLVMCPTQYNKGWSSGDYLDVLGRTLDPAIHVMWTGNSVVSDLDRPSMEWINARIRRRAFIWWNFPVSDFVRNHLLLGPVYGNGSDIGDQLGGFVSNPMERSEASKVALFGVADYSWNLKTYDAGAAWRAGIREVIPGAAEAYEVFSRHNSDLGPNGHGYRRQESVDFAPLAQTYLTGVREEEAPDPKPIRAEFEKIREAPATIRGGAGNQALLEEIGPWLDAFEQLGAAGVAVIDAQTALVSENTEEAWKHLSTSLAALDRMSEINLTHNRNPHQPGVRTGSLVVAPMVHEMAEIVGSRLFAKLSGRPVFRPTGITSAQERVSLPLMLDGRDDTYFYCKEIQKAGDWFGLDLGGVHEIRRISIIQGRNDGDHDRIHKGVIEGLSGKSWDKIADVEAARIDVTLDPPKPYRSVRIRVLKAGKPDGTKPDVWTAIRRFEVNPKDSAELRTDIPAFRSQPVRVDKQEVSVAPMLETHAFPPDRFLGLLLPEAMAATQLVVDLKAGGSADHFALEATADGRSWNRLETTSEGSVLTARLDGKIIAVRVRNAGGATPAVTLRKFALGILPAAEADSLATLSDGRLATSAEFTPDGNTVIRPPDGVDPVAVTFLISSSYRGSAELTAMIGSQRRPLGTIKGGYGNFPLPPGTTGVVLSAPAGHGTLPLHEVIWTSR